MQRLLSRFGCSVGSYKALEYLRGAVEQGHSDAIILYAEGSAFEWDGFEKDINLAKDLLISELKLGNPAADVALNEIIIWEPQNRFELLTAEQNLVRLAEDGQMSAIAALATIHGVPRWFENVGKKFAFKPKPDIALNFALQLLDSTDGVALLRNLIETSYIGQTFDQDQAKLLVKRLEEIALDPLIFDVSASIDASFSLAQIYEYGVLGPIDSKKTLEFRTCSRSMERYGCGECRLVILFTAWVL